MFRISKISVVDPGRLAAGFPRSVSSSSFFSGLWTTDSLNH